MININKINPWNKIPNIINVIIEIPKGSINKSELNKKTGLLKLDRKLSSSVHYPGDYGFIPKTLMEDDDPMDVLILTNKSVKPLKLAKVRILGIFKMTDCGEEDDKIIGVYSSESEFRNLNGIKDISKQTIKDITHFFETYKKLEGEKCKITKILGKEEAYKEIEKAIEMYKK